MKTEDLITALSSEASPEPGVGAQRRLLPYLLLGLVVVMALYALLLGPRPDLEAALATPIVLAKTLLPLCLGLLALVLAARSARPGARPLVAGQVIWIVPVAAAALFVLAFATTPPDLRMILFMGHSIPICLPAIPLLSIPMTTGLILALRRDAPVRPVRCGLLAGLASAGLAAAVYSTFCIEDSPLFYSVWYSLGIGLGAGLGAWAGHRWLRW